MKKRSYAAGVLDEADRELDIINWRLFCDAQESMLYGYGDSDRDKPGYWVPGVRLYKKAGSHIRPMFEDVDPDESEHYSVEVFYEPWPDVGVCGDCEVAWHDVDNVLEPTCWMCGLEPVKTEKQVYTALPGMLDEWVNGDVSIDEVIAYSVVDAEATQRIYAAMAPSINLDDERLIYITTTGNNPTIFDMETVSVDRGQLSIDGVPFDGVTEISVPELTENDMSDWAALNTVRNPTNFVEWVAQFSNVELDPWQEDWLRDIYQISRGESNGD